VAVSLGDPSGIGPEVTARALAIPAVRRALVPLVFGDEAVWEAACRAAGLVDPLARADSAQEARGPAIVPVGRLAARDRRPGKPSEAGGRAQLAFLEQATRAVEAGCAAALCTAPVSKEQIARAGRAFTGHTEFLADRSGSRVLMLLAGPRLRVAVHTTHLALADVPGRLSEDGIVEDLRILDRGLRQGFGIARPRLAVCGLNPHAGEGGLFGDEERRIIAPAVKRARAARLDVSGPFAADGVIPRAAQGAFDGVLAMYHDQGLVALKLLHFDDGVNVTLGLPFPRTSPDHGVAYDLAGSVRARCDSMAAALLLAARLGRERG